MALKNITPREEAGGLGADVHGSTELRKRPTLPY